MSRSVRVGQSRKVVADRYNHATDEGVREWLGKLWATVEAEYNAYIEEKATAGEDALGHVNTGDTKTPSSGEKNDRSRLKASDIPVIRTRLESETIKAVAESYGVPQRAITLIRDGKNWKIAG